MTPQELAHFRGFLQGRQAELESLLRNREVIAVHSSADVTDQIQHATERDMAIGSLERESLQLREVRGALDRIGLGTFGSCLGCEETISMKRLKALPWTTSCIECRQSLDRKQMHMPNEIDVPLFDNL